MAQLISSFVVPHAAKRGKSKNSPAINHFALRGKKSHDHVASAPPVPKRARFYVPQKFATTRNKVETARKKFDLHFSPLGVRPGNSAKALAAIFCEGRVFGAFRAN